MTLLRNTLPVEELSEERFLDGIREFGVLKSREMDTAPGPHEQSKMEVRNISFVSS